MYYGITLVISFHPIFITKVDQAFHVKCFFEEASKGLTAELGVSMLPTTEVEARHGIPGCSYSIHRSSIDELDAGKPAGAVIQFARVGDKVLHQWYCSTNEMFGILINNCFVTDGVKQRVQVIDAQGCPLDPILITGTRYSADLQRAYAESQVFKFADRPGIWFFCQIQMCMKKDGMCDGITPPNCPGVGIKSGKVLPYKRNEGDKPVKKGGIYADEEEHDEVKKNKNDSQNEVLSEQTRLFEQNKSNATNGPTLSGSDYEPLEVIQPPATNIDEEDDESSRPEFTTTSLKVPIAKRPTTAKENESINYVSPPSYANIAEAPSTEPEIQVFSPGYNSTNYQIGNDPPVALSKTITIDNNNPYLPPQPVLRSNGNNNKQHEVVNTEYETEANIPRRKQQTKNDKEITSSSILLPTLNTIAHKTVTSQRESPTISTRKINNKKDEVEDYSDSDELNIPPSLHNLLANLQPDQINAQSLQKMFKDSVADRRALLQSVDFIIRKMNKEAEEEKGVEEETRRDRREKDLDNDEEQVEFIEDRTEENWKEEDERRNEQMAELLMKMEVYKKLKGKGEISRMARDSPINFDRNSREKENKIQSQHVDKQYSNKWHQNQQNDPQTISGQLLIFDLDETPPISFELQKHINSADECALTKNSLSMLGFASASLALILLLITILIFLKYGKIGKDEKKI